MSFTVSSSAHVQGLLHLLPFKKKEVHIMANRPALFALTILVKLIKAGLSKKRVSCRRWLMFCLVLFMWNCCTQSLVSGPLYLSPGNELVAWIQQAVSYFHWIKQDHGWKNCIFEEGGGGHDISIQRCCQQISPLQTKWLWGLFVQRIILTDTIIELCHGWAAHQRGVVQRLVSL